jgi:hypothetical protein
MADLTQEQIERVAQAIRESAYPGSWDKIGDNEKPIYLRAAHAAIRVAQLPWEPPTEAELQRFAHEYRNLNGAECDQTAARVALGAAFERRNAALQPKPVDPRREKIIAALDKQYLNGESSKIADAVLAALNEVE